MEPQAVRSDLRFPAECNLLNIPFRWVCLFIAVIQLMQNICLVVTFPFRNNISCKAWRNGIDSLIFQHGDNVWAAVGLLIAIFCIVTNLSLFIGSVYYIPDFILFWYYGATIQFVYLLSFQTSALAKKILQSLSGKKQNFVREYKLGFILCLFFTIYLYTTFIFKVQLFYNYVSYKLNTQLRFEDENV